jgi:hypothetical protein
MSAVGDAKDIDQKLVINKITNSMGLFLESEMKLSSHSQEHFYHYCASTPVHMLRLLHI